MEVRVSSNLYRFRVLISCGQVVLFGTAHSVASAPKVKPKWHTRDKAKSVTKSAVKSQAAAPFAFANLRPEEVEQRIKTVKATEIITGDGAVISIPTHEIVAEATSFEYANGRDGKEFGRTILKGDGEKLASLWIFEKPDNLLLKLTGKQLEVETALTTVSFEGKVFDYGQIPWRTLSQALLLAPIRHVSLSIGQSWL